jgi:hypothetical protein
VPLAAGDADGQVGVRPHDPQLPHLREPLRVVPKLFGDAAPVLHWIVLPGDVTRAVDEVLVFLDRHLGILGVRVDRLERAAPA